MQRLTKKKRAAKRRSRASKKPPDSKNPRTASHAENPKQREALATSASPPEANGRGRPTKYRPQYAAVARSMTRLGATDYNIAQALGVVPSTVSLWQTQHADFSEALRAGKGEYDDRVERSLAQRAIGYSYDATKILQHEGKPIIVPYIEHCPPDVNACKLWLMNRRPEEWRDIARIEATGKDGAPLVPEVSDRSMARAILDILREAKIEKIDDGESMP